MVNNVKVFFKKKKGTNNELVIGPQKKKSIFFELLYWCTSFIHHCLDVIHIKKNICESIASMLLDISNKTKDDLNARLDLVEMNIRGDQVPEKRGTHAYLPLAKYTSL